MARVVSSGGKGVAVWKLQTSPAPKLIGVARSTALSSGQSGGFFTSVSSNGNSNPIIWALSRPLSQSATAIALYAFNPESGSSMTPLFKSKAGDWPNFFGNSNQVPVVANGKVYVASNKELQIFGLKPAKPRSK
jgi:hypothetical protein